MDAVNHFFGPSSLENEEVVRRLDATLADLFAFINNTVGLKHTLIVFASDHGIDARKVHRLVHSVDVAPTIAAFLGMAPPASSRGLPLVEVLQ